MPNLIGLHDLESTAIALPDTWLLDTVALSENPPPKSYPSSLHVIARLNHGYGSTGTLPVPDQYNWFAEKVAQYVNGSHNCTRWIIGNESNLSREWPGGQPIFPWQYAACYKLCRQAIHALPGHEQDTVLVAGSGPWNDQLKYAQNPNGDWIRYFTDVLSLLGNGCDGFALHSYTHSYDPGLVTSTARMDSPFQNRYFEFRAYQDYLLAVPEGLRYLPVYLTEANGGPGWVATGLMPAMLQEIDTWNRSGEQPISCVIFYRYPRYDDFYIEGRDDVIAEYNAAAMLNYHSPDVTPPVPAPEPTPEPEREIDPALAQRGVDFQYALVAAGTWYWRITYAEHLDEAEADAVGPDHHALGEILRDGMQIADVAIQVTWPSGSTTVYSKPDDPNATYNWNYPMSPSLNEFSFCVNDGAPSDKISGVGMGKDGNPAIHTSTWITFEWVQAGEPEPPEPTPSGAKILWPVDGPITQYFGAHGISYPGEVGHDGIDFGVPIGTDVIAPADGIVEMVDNQPEGFGLYLRVFHPHLNLHTLVAHLSEQWVSIGDSVVQAQCIGKSGDSGNSTGPHCHLSWRLGTEGAAYYELHDGYDQGATNPLAVYALLNQCDPNLVAPVAGH